MTLGSFSVSPRAAASDEPFVCSTIVSLMPRSFSYWLRGLLRTITRMREPRSALDLGTEPLRLSSRAVVITPTLL